MHLIYIYIDISGTANMKHDISNHDRGVLAYSVV